MTYVDDKPRPVNGAGCWIDVDDIDWYDGIYGDEVRALMWCPTHKCFEWHFIDVRWLRHKKAARWNPNLKRYK